MTGALLGHPGPVFTVGTEGQQDALKRFTVLEGD